MVLVDTSVWIDHLCKGDRQLEDLLRAGSVVIHHFVVGELACGSIRNRREILQLLGALPFLPPASHEDAIALIERRSLHGKGLGYVDIHLLASCLIGHVPLWTRDKTLRCVTKELNVQYDV